MAGLRRRYQELLTEAPEDAPAVEFDGTWCNWGQMRSVADQLEVALTKHGLGDAARVGIVLENRPEHVAALVTMLATDRCMVALSPLQPPERLEADIARSEVPVVVASGAMLDRPGVQQAALVGGLVLRLDPDGSLSELGGSADLSERKTNPGVAIEMMTSGTTGPPKRVDLTDLQVDRAIHASASAPPEGQLLRFSVSLVVAPLVHIGGLWSVLAPLYAGRRIAMLTKFAVEPWLEMVERHRPRAAGLVPPALRAVLDADVDPARLSSLQVVTCGTTYCPPELATAFYDKYGIRVLMTYGATEFAGAIAAWTKPMHEKWWDTKKGSVGRASRGVHLRVVGDGGESLEPGVEGVLEIRSEQSPEGADVWVRSSDRAVIDTDGFVFINGRTDDAIIRGGFKIHPRTVQAALERHPSVVEAAVVPRADRRLGQVPVAVVEVADGDSRPEPEELRKLCREVLMPYEVPATVLVVDQLPRTASAKVSRVGVLELVAADQLDQQDTTNVG